MDGVDGVDGVDGIPRSKTELYSRLASVNVLAGTSDDVQVYCDDGTDIALNGGCDGRGSTITTNRPGWDNTAGDPDPAFWWCDFDNTTAATVQVFAYVHCIDVP